MGGSGSGRTADRNTVEDCLTLSAARLMSEKLLRAHLHYAGSITWTNTHTGEKVSSIGYDPDIGADSGSIRLHHTNVRTGDKMDYRIRLTTTPLPWGGRRWWFICPLVVSGRPCGRRVGKLHLPPGARYFGCRRCYNLTYESCRESHKYDRLWHNLGRDTGMDPATVRRLMEERFA